MLNIQEMLNRRYFETNDAGASTLYYLHVDAGTYSYGWRFGRLSSVSGGAATGNRFRYDLFYESTNQNAKQTTRPIGIIYQGNLSQQVAMVPFLH